MTPGYGYKWQSEAKVLHLRVSLTPRTSASEESAPGSTGCGRARSDVARLLLAVGGDQRLESSIVAQRGEVWFLGQERPFARFQFDRLGDECEDLVPIAMDASAEQ